MELHFSRLVDVKDADGANLLELMCLEAITTTTIVFMLDTTIHLPSTCEADGASSQTERKRFSREHGVTRESILYRL